MLSTSSCAYWPYGSPLIKWLFKIFTQTLNRVAFFFLMGRISLYILDMSSLTDTHKLFALPSLLGLLFLHLLPTLPWDLIPVLRTQGWVALGAACRELAACGRPDKWIGGVSFCLLACFWGKGCPEDLEHRELRVPISFLGGDTSRT